MQLHPREQFTIVRQIEDHTDSATYYVQAVVRNAKTDALLATVNLTDQGSRRFSKTYSVPVDVSGQGFYISVLTSVYTDSGYTTKSQNYGDKMDIYLVQDRVNPNLGSGGGGSDVSYKKIREIVREEAVAAVKAINIPEAKVVTVTKEVVREVKVPTAVDIKFPSQKPILDAIKAVGKKVDEKPVTEIPEVHEMDMTPMMEKIDAGIEGLKVTVAGEVAKVGKKLDELDIVELKLPERKSVEPAPIKSPYDERTNRLMKKS